MASAKQCPRCLSELQYSEMGGLFTLRCARCEWEQSGTVSYPHPEVQRGTSIRLSVQATTSPPSALALKALRDCSSSAKSLSAGELHQKLASGDYFTVGVFPEYKGREVATELERMGFKVLSIPDDES